MHRRCLKGLRTVRWRRCQAEIFAYCGEFARWDGLTERYTLYEVCPRPVMDLPEPSLACPMWANLPSSTAYLLSPRKLGRCRMQDDACTRVSEVREMYKRRRDCLRERRTQPERASTLELFAPGAAGALRSMYTARGLWSAEFDAAARVDGLVRRTQQACKRASCTPTVPHESLPNDCLRGR